jgi:PAS domain S-box-containing protein
MTEKPVGSEISPPGAETVDNFRIFFDLCPDFLFVLNMAGDIILANKTVLAILGYSNEELTGMSVLRLHPEGRRDEAGVIVTEMIEGRRDFCPIPLLTRNGREIPVETRVVRGMWNSEPCLFGYSRNLTDLKQSDITDLKNAERRLRENEERLQLTLSGADLGTWDWHVPTGDVHFNRRWAEMLGYGPEEIDPHVRTWEKLLHPEDTAPVTATLRRHLDGKTDAYQTEHRLRSKWGTWVWVLDSGRVIQRDAEGKPLRMAGIHMDITERKNAEAELLRHREQLEELVRERTLRLEKAQKELLLRAVEAGRLQTLDIMLHNIGNAVTPILLQADQMAMLNGDQTVKYLEACYRDLCNHREELNRYIMKEKRGIEVFSYMERLLENLREQQGKTTDAVTTLKNAVGHISQILKVHSLPAENGGMKERLGVASLVENALRIQEASLKKRGIRVQTRLKPGLLITANRNSMMQVIMNLIKNAYEALDASNRDPSGKEIFIHSFHHGGRVCLEIGDNGIGLESHTPEAVFETGVSAKGSSGFGLFYSKAIVEAIGGTVSFKSDGKEKGAVVRMEFKEQ